MAPVSGRSLGVPILLAVLAALLYGSAAAPNDADARIRRWAHDAGQRTPLYRVGLSDAAAIEVTSAKPFRILDPVTGEPVWKPVFQGRLRAVADGAPAGGVARVYRVQVGAYGDAAAAQLELDRLARRFDTVGVVHHDPDRGNWRVRIGQAADRLALNPLLDRLREAGVQDFWIAEEAAAAAEGVRLRLVDDAYESHLTASARLVLVPSGETPVEVGGKRYRGVLELRITPFGTVRAINWIELEKYLLGVVPAELGPEVWPQLAALQAQAVAARTYAWRNRGQFGEDGFDLCATPRCQVYAGADAEHPLSDRAVTATRGEVLTWNSQPIVALYTATCGGHTEDGGEVFAEHAEPYLKGVPCRAENDALATLRATVPGRTVAPLFDETGRDITRDWSLLQAAGVLPDPPPLGVAGSTLSADALRQFTRALALLAGLPAPGGAPRPAGDLGQAAAALLADLGWDRRAELLLSGEDLPALLRDAAAVALPEAQRRSLAYLAWVEGLAPFADGSFHVERAPGVGRLVPALAQIGGTYEALGLSEGVVSGMGKASLRLVRHKSEVRLPLAARPFLFALAGGRPVPSAALEVWPGDRVRYRTDADGAVDFLELRPPVKGTSDDRSSAVYSWEVRRTRRQLEALINERISVGRLKDLKVKRRGVSGRISELEVLGTRGTSVIRGFDVRRLLDLRESLTVIEIQRDGDGDIAAVVFAGKGWGHGVGMCQVGAYGMALRGASYREILAHYYRETELAPIRDE